MLQTERHEKKMRGGIFSKNILGARERQNENSVRALKNVIRLIVILFLKLLIY
jgi:hypothetical protein